MSQQLAFIICVVISIADAVNAQRGGVTLTTGDIGKHRDKTFTKELKEVLRINETYGDVYFMGKCISNLNELKSAQTLITAVSKKYELFLEKLYETNSNYNWKQWSYEMVKSGSSLHQLINALYKLVLDKKLFDKIKKAHTNSDCENSENEILYNIYKALDLAQFKGFVMTQIAISYLNILSRNPPLNLYKSRAKAVLRIAQNAMRDSKTEIRRNDPANHVQNVTYITITKLLQGIILNVESMNGKGLFCEDTCEDNTYLKKSDVKCGDNVACMKQKPFPCQGTMRDCKALPQKISACFTGSNALRKLEFIDYTGSKLPAEDKMHCKKGVTKLDSFTKIIKECSYCLCLCDEEISSERYINMRRALSDIRKNKVVTGLRFVKVNRIIHIQIQEGTLRANGQIDQKTVAWRPIENYSIGTRKRYKNQDYFILTYDQRTVDLDDVFVPSTKDTQNGWIMTGVRFRKIGQHLNFEIHTTKYNYKTGTLVPKSSHWVANDNTPFEKTQPRREHHLRESQVPTRSPKRSIVASEHNTFMKFTHTSIELDAAQTTIPFLDAQPVTPQISTPLCGAGIYYKGQPGYGGFFALKIMNCDLSKNLRTSLYA